MEQVCDRSFIGENVPIDGKVFIRCTFTDCTFVFCGAALWAMNECRTETGCSFKLEGCAERTIKALKQLLDGTGAWADFAKWILEPLITPPRAKN